MSKLGTIFGFVLGAAAGTAVTWKVLKTKYERLAQEEIKSVKEVYSKKLRENDNTVGEQAEEQDVVYQEECEYTEKVKELGYSTFTESEGDNMKKKVKKKPYVISPEEFSEIDDYDTVTLFYYKDQVVANTSDEVVDDVDELVGLDSLSRFGEYEDCSVFVRNEDLKTDFEILLDERKYTDVVS